MGRKEKGCSPKASEIKRKLADQAYMKTAVSIISEQLVYFFYDEWKEEEE